MVEASNTDPVAANNPTTTDQPATTEEVKATAATETISNTADGEVISNEENPNNQASAAAATEQEEESKVESRGLPKISKGVTPLPKTLRGQFEYGLSLKEEGNFYFKQRDYANAVKKYARVRAFLKPMIPSGDGQQDNAQFLNMISQQSNNDDDKLTKAECKQAIQVQA